MVKEQELQVQGELYSVGKEGVRRPPGHDPPGCNFSGESPGYSDLVGSFLGQEGWFSGSVGAWRGQSRELR